MTKLKELPAVCRVKGAPLIKAVTRSNTRISAEDPWIGTQGTCLFAGNRCSVCDKGQNVRIASRQAGVPVIELVQ